MIVTLIASNQIYTMALPQKVSGRYWIIDHDESGHTRQIADIEGIQNCWLIHSSPVLGLLNDQHGEAATLELGNDTHVINAYYKNDDSRVQLLIEPSTLDRQSYKKYCVSGSCRLNIGRAEDNHIVFSNKYVSSHHACLIWDRGMWSITDTQSSNGTFVNDHRIATKKLNPGDTVYIMGLKIIVGSSFFAINNPDESVQIKSKDIAELAAQESEVRSSDCLAEPKKEHFFRSPRLFRQIQSCEVRVDAPPPREKSEEVPIALLLGPALTMGMTAVVMGAVAAINLSTGQSDFLSSVPTIIMSVSMLCGTLLWPFMTKRHEKRVKIKAETNRQKKYLEYLDGIKSQIYRIIDEQRTILLENYPSSADCETRIFNRERTLWERTSEQEDFLTLRLGLGKVPLAADMKFPENRFSLDDDMLQNEVNRLSDLPKQITDAPITLSLAKNAVTGVVGECDRANAFLHNLILQIISLHGYDEVKLLFIFNEADHSDWIYAKHLPHIWNDDGDVRYLATNEEEAKILSMYLEHIIQERSNTQSVHSTTPKPHYVVVALDTDTADRSDIFERIRSAPESAGVSCVTIASGLMALPKECSAVVELAQQESTLYVRNAQAGVKTVFRAEGAARPDMDRVTNILSNIVLTSANAQYALPNMVTFLEMYGVGKTEHLNSLTRWRDNSPVNSLQAPVGVGMAGELFNLDLHEKAHGPHGLIAGMTGSGKSEFIITFVLSMAVNYHPDEVSFILIDYKGGGLAGAFEDQLSGVKLPHLAGTITNLDGSSVNRALISLQSELRRRQVLFNEARQISGEGTIDIYKYQKMYRSGLVTQPVPHLFVVSDEFAELKAQQPEFMSQLISAARIGRSLGVHLILATQKPTGVVDDQIWSNSRFRVCLKVQERADSVEMLKRPDAAELKDTGRFYLQVGFNELFEMGQSAWCGAPYIPNDRIEKKRNDSVAVIDHLGRVLIETKAKPALGGESQSSQVVSIVSYLSDLAKSEQVEAKCLWLPEIPALIYLDELKQKYHWQADPYVLAPVIGEYDDPANQSQGLLTIPFSEKGNALVYGIAGGGKTTLLNTVLMGLLSDYTAEQLNVYVIDMGEENLQSFAVAPQVGDVLLSTDSEEIGNLFKMLAEEIARRKKLFASGDGSYESYCRNVDNAFPQILVVLRNYAAFSEQFEMLDERLIQLTRDCNKYGIYFLITANAANTVRYRVAQNFANVYALQLNDTSDYVGLFGGTNGFYPAKIKGRGIFKTTLPYEFQTAHFSRDAGQDSIRTMVGELAKKSDARAKPIPTLPERVTAAFFKESYSVDALPVGVERASLQPAMINLNQSVVSIVLAQTAGELSETAQGICELLSKQNGVTTVLDGAGIVEESLNMEYDYISGSFAGRIEALFEEMVRRNNTYKNAVAANKDTEPYEAEFFVITGLQEILNSLTVEGRDKLNTLLEKAELAYNIHFILCEGSKAMSGHTSAAWCKRHVSGTDGIWVGDGIADQYILKIGKITNNLYSEVPPGFGYVVKRGRPVLVKLIEGENGEEGTDE